MALFRRLLVLCLLALAGLGLPLGAQAAPMLTGAELGQITALVGERTYGDGSGVVLSSGASLGNALDWLDTFTQEEVGYVREYVSDLLQMVELVKDHGGSTPNLARIQADMEAVFQSNADLYTDLNYYQTKLTYCYDRLGFLTTFLYSEGLDGTYQQELSQEMRDLQGEGQALLTDLVNSQGTYQSTLGSLRGSMEIMADVEEVRAAAAPILEQEAMALYQAESAFLASGNQVDIQVLSTKQIGVKLVDKQPGIQVEMWRADDSSRSSLKTATTNQYGTAVFWIADFRPNRENKVEVAIRVTGPGMRSRTIEKITLKGSYSTWLRLEADNGAPYFTMMCLNGKDILSKELEVQVSKQNTEKQALHFQMDTKGQSCRVRIRQYRSLWSGYTTFFDQTITDGRLYSVDSPWFSQLIPDKNVEVLVEYAGKSITYTTQLKPKKSLYEKPVQTSSKPTFFPTFALVIPREVPILGGGRVEFPLPVDNWQVYIDLDGTSFIGINKDLGEIKKVKWQSQDSIDRAEYQKELKKTSAKNRLLYEAKTAKKEFDESSRKFFGSSSAKFSAYFYAMLINNPKTGRAEGGATVGVSFTFLYEATWTFQAGPIPVFIGFTFNAGFGVGREVRMSMILDGLKDWRVLAGGGYSAQFTLGIGITAGAGIPKIAYIQLRGGFSFVVGFSTKAGEATAAMALALTVDLELRLVFFQKSWRLWEWGYHKNLIQMQDMLVASAANSYVSAQLDPMNLDRYPYFDDVAAALTGGALPAVEDAGTGVKPDKYVVQIPHLGAVDTNVRLVTFGKQFEIAFFIAKVQVNGKAVPRLCWVNMEDPTKRGVTHALGNSLFDYDFDLYFDGLDLYLIVQCGTRNNLYIPPNPTDAEREALLVKAQRQTSIYIHRMRSMGNGTLQSYGTPLHASSNGIPSGTAVGQPRIAGLKNKQNEGARTADMTVSYVATYYNDAGEPYLHRVVSNLLDASRGVLFNQGWMVMVDVNPKQYIIGDVALLDYVVKRGTGYYTPVVTILHSKTAGEQNLLLMANTPVSGPSQAAVLVRGEFQTLRPAFLQGSFGNITPGVLVVRKENNAKGEPVTKLAGLWADKNRTNFQEPNAYKVEYVDYGIEVGADGVDAFVPSHARDPYIQVYAYWPQSIEDDGVGGKHYAIRAVLLNIDEKTVTPPFTMLELDELPIKAQLLNRDTVGRSLCYYLGTKEKGLGAKQGLYGVQFPTTVSIAIESVAAEDPVIGTGDPLSLLMRVKSAGNLVVDHFEVAMEANGKQFALVRINARNDVDNAVQIYDHANNLVATQGQKAAFRLPGSYDSLNGEVLTTRSGTFNASGALQWGNAETHLIKGFLPGNTRVYKVEVDHTPEDWKDFQKVTLRVASINASYALENPYGGVEGLHYQVDTATGAVMETVTQADGYTQSAPAAAAYARYGAPLDGAGARQDQDVLVDIYRNDQVLDAQVEYFGGEEAYVTLNLNNLANDFAPDMPALLTAVLPNGQEAYRFQFARALEGRYGYNVLIPLAQLAGGQPMEEVQVMLGNAGDPNQYRELENVDNQARIKARAMFDIIGPEDLVRFEGEEAVFTVEPDGDQTGPYTYQWQYRMPDGTWYDLPGETGPTLTLKGLTLADNGKVFWCVVYDRNGRGRMSQEALLTVLRQAEPPLTGDGWPLELLVALGGALALALVVYLLRRKRKG